MQIVVVGAGVIGLTAAIRLLEAGHGVRMVAAEEPTATTSAIAAAVWFPTHVGPPERVSSWGSETFAVLAEHAARGVPGLVMRESLQLYRTPPGEPAWTTALDTVRAATAGELPEGYPYGLRFAVPLAEMPLYLPWLQRRMLGLGGIFSRHRVGALDEVAEGSDVVVNCTGLGARQLVGDRSVHPVRGRIVRVTNPGLSLSVRDEDHPAGRAYVHPRTNDCILGGTLDEGAWDTSIDLAAGDAIVERCRDLVPELRDARVLEHVVGLRPGRPTVRLEEDEPLASGARVIHDYGHGGAGITLGWGCAREVVDLVDSRDA
ncbi:FAD-dependent oxidoreductase [Mycolicibacterium lacusdiani]|uniref:FAD-dependent oxidoreductase n=1 Tax=Mycolicibacterium lacusdiani TaxID=2895283 RepID=UPI001F22F997|nr:FAD-dependent oxidoreductase [Mycolicibacterium lacusdiani]